ncbi:MAG: hypothetical protein KF724_12640 [Phycisphaeraceae bacterium]|nr:hypothetical protein [Phycisphaeraceae bacterium]
MVSRIAGPSVFASGTSPLAAAWRRFGVSAVVMVAVVPASAVRAAWAVEMAENSAARLTTLTAPTTQAATPPSPDRAPAKAPGSPSPDAPTTPSPDRTVPDPAAQPAAPEDRSAPPSTRSVPASRPVICDIVVRGYDRTRPADAVVEPGPAVISGALVYTRVDVDLDEAPLASALSALARAAKVNILPIFRPAPDRPGLDRAVTVSLSLDNVTALEALESILLAGTGLIDATWQIRGNIIECAPKVILADSSRREIRTHDISDLRFEIPNFSPRLPKGTDRRKPKEVTADFVRMIVTQVEPDAWREPTGGSDDPSSLGQATPSGAAPTPAHNLFTDDTDEQRKEFFVRGQWASLHLKNDRLLVINAPGFIHRQLEGMGPLVPPAASAEPRRR